MRKINKSPNVPPTLVNAPVPTNATEVDKTIYRADDVCKQLISDQYNKCCYCECDLTKRFNDVEHYRYKGHYYWLGHDWNNLLYSCDLCNRVYKKDRFPLALGSIRATSPADDISRESPLIINPAFVEPSDHIKFRRYEAINLTNEGEETIKIFDLNNQGGERAELIEERKLVFAKYEEEMKQVKFAERLLSLSGISTEIAYIAINMLASCKRSIALMTSPLSPHSGMLISQI